jgi:hypothetical protein
MPTRSDNILILMADGNYKREIAETKKLDVEDAARDIESWK